MQSSSSRFSSARRNVRIARYAIGVTAAAALAAFAAAARASHPGSHQRVRAGDATSALPASDQSSTGTYFGGDDGYSIGPSGSASPQVHSGAS
jgi:hypothetical protein